MEFSESTHLLLSRIREIDPDISSKAMGYILLKEYDNGELIRLAYGPDSAIHALIEEIKSAVPLIKMSSPRPPPIITTDTAANISKQGLRLLQQHHQLLSPTATPIAMSAAAQFQSQQTATYWADQEPQHIQYTPRSTLDPHVPYATAQGGGHHMVFNTDDFNPYSTDFTSDSAATIMGPRTIRRSSSYLSSESPPPLMSSKTCHYYHKGYCKHGVNCRYLHDLSAPLDGYAAYAAANSQSNDLAAAANDDHEFVPGSLEKLEAEITELLRSRRGQPISIAMLPMLYQDKYGKVLQADGYLTESQRHGKAGYNLTKLLARMKSSIRLIDRPHGQHSVILAEDLPPPSFEYRGERNDLGSAVSGSQQIYLTFPADSTFTEDDIADYFSQFGPVQAVRIPLQHKRMFGFVTFAHSETVQLVFAKGNPHYICDSRVLVKPYREKTRKSYEKIEIPICYHQQYADFSTELQPLPKLFEARIYRKQFEELNRHMTEFHLTNHHLFSFNPCVGYNTERLRFHQEASLEPNQVPPADESVNQENTTNEQASQIELPDSPFASL